MSILDQLTLAPAALAGVHAVPMDEANVLLEKWGHYLGACNRPFGQEGFVLATGHPVAVAVSASTVSATVTCAHGITYTRKQLVELARLAAAERWSTRVMLRLWREVCAPAWPHWLPAAAIAYSRNDRHEGRIYRFDGWERCTVNAGSSGGGTWSTTRTDDDAAGGAKTLWLWHYDEPAPLSEVA